MAVIDYEKVYNLHQNQGNITSLTKKNFKKIDRSIFGDSKYIDIFRYNFVEHIH